MLKRIERMTTRPAPSASVAAAAGRLRQRAPTDPRPRLYEVAEAPRLWLFAVISEYAMRPAPHVMAASAVLNTGQK